MTTTTGRRARRPRRTLATLLLLSCAMPFSAVRAESYLTQLEWIHPKPEQVASFRVLFALGPDDQARPTAIPVGKPLAVDRFVWPIDVPEHGSVWVAVVAVGHDGRESAPSEWRRYDWRPGQGPLGDPGRPYLVDESAR